MCQDDGDGLLAVSCVHGAGVEFRSGRKQIGTRFGYFWVEIVQSQEIPLQLAETIGWRLLAGQEVGECSKMSFFTSFQELLDYDHSTNLNGFHFSNSLFGFDSNSVPPLENLPPPVPVESVLTTPTAPSNNLRASLTTPSPIPELVPLVETPKQQCQIMPSPQIQQPAAPQEVTKVQNHEKQPSHAVHQQTSPIPIVSKFQLKVTPNNEIYISNESGTFCELAGSFVPSAVEQPIEVSIAEQIPLQAVPEPVRLHEVPPPEEPTKTLYCIEKGVKRPLSPSDQRYSNSGIFRSTNGSASLCSPLKKKATSFAANGISSSGTEAKLVVSNVINNGLIVNKKHLSNGDEQPAPATKPTPERRIMRPKKKKRKAAPKVTVEAKIEPTNGKLVARIAPEPVRTVPPPLVSTRKIPPEPINRRIVNHQDNILRPPGLVKMTAASAIDSSALNFSGIKEKAAQEAIFIQRVQKHKQSSAPIQQPVHQLPLQKKVVQNGKVPAKEPLVTTPPPSASPLVPDESNSTPPPVELKLVADLVMDKDVFGHISLLNGEKNRGRAVVYQNPVTTKNIIYSILNPKSLNLSLGGVDRGTTATLTLEPHRGGRKPKKRGRKKKVTENGTAVSGVNGLLPTSNNLDQPTIDPSVPVSVTRSGRLSRPPRYANSYFQNMKQRIEHSPPPPPPPLPPPTLPRLDVPAPDPETAEKLPNFSAALTSVVHPQNDTENKRKIKVPLQYRCATCNKIYLGKRMQRHLQKYPSHNSERDCVGPGREKKKAEEEKSTYLYKHLFDLLQKFTEKDKGRVMLKEISNFVDFVRALIPKLITNDEQNSTVEYIDHNVADVLRLNHGKYRLKLSSLAEEYEKLNLTVNLLNNNSNTTSTYNGSTVPITSTPNGNADRQSMSFNADDLLNHSSSFPSLTTLMHEHNLLHANNNHNITNNTNINHHQYNNHYLPQYHNSHYNNHHHHLPLIGSTCHDDAMNSLTGLCKSPVQHSTSGMVNMALNLY